MNVSHSQRAGEIRFGCMGTLAVALGLMILIGAIREIVSPSPKESPAPPLVESPPTLIPTISPTHKPEPSPEELAQFSAREWLNDNLPEPSSLEIIRLRSARQDQPGANGFVVYVKYRAKNEVGGYSVTERFFVTDSRGILLNTMEYNGP
jgi:hypothetical protein